MAINHDKIQHNIRRISQVSIGIALFCLLLVAVLYAVMYAQKDTIAATNTNTNTTTQPTLTPAQIAAEKTSYESSVASAFSGFAEGTTTSASIAEQLQKISVPVAYRSLHVQLVSIMQSPDDTEAVKLQKIQSLDTQYSWLLK